MTKFIALLLSLPFFVFGEGTPTLNLEEGNFVHLNDVVTSDSVSRVQRQLLEISAKDPKKRITIVLNSPGGSIPAGQLLIETIKSLPNPIDSVTIFAASMAFQIAQYTQNRYVLDSGVLMSHRASISGIGGNIDGEVESRLGYIKQLVDILDYNAAKRMSTEVQKYKDRIVKELWAVGGFSVKENMADKVVKLSCSAKLASSSETIPIRTFFGLYNVEFSKCPLIVAPLSVTQDRKSRTKNSTEYINLLYNNKKEFVKRYITTGKLNGI